MTLRRTRSCPAHIDLMRDLQAESVRRRPESPTDLRASVRRQTNTLLDQNAREAASVRAPGVGGQPLVSGAGVRLSTYAWRFSAPHDLPAPELRGDRFGLTAQMPAFDGNMINASFYGDTLQFGDSFQGPHGLGGSAFVMFRDGEFSPGLGAGWFFLGGLTFGFSMAMKLVGRGHTRVLGFGNGRMLVEQRSRRAQGPQASFGLGVTMAGPFPWVGVVGRFASQQGETRTLTTWTTPDCLGAIESDGQVRQAAVAWEQQAPILPWPTEMPFAEGLTLPALQVGERFARSIEGSAKYGASFALFGVLNGRYRATDNRIEITAERPSATTLRIGRIDEQAEAVTYATELPIFANAAQTWLHSRATEQVFEFDMTVPEGRHAAAAMWYGVLPEGAWEAPPEPPDARWLTRLGAYDHLPAGVTRSRTAWLTRPRESHGSIAAGLPWYTPRWLRAGREQLWRSSSDSCVGWFAGNVRVSHRWQTAIEAQRYHSDARVRTIAANHEQNFTQDGPLPGTTRVTTQWRYGRFGSRARAGAVDWLNRFLLTDAPLPPFPSDCPASAYTMEVTREAPPTITTSAWNAGEFHLAEALGAPPAFVHLCAQLRARGDGAMPWLHALADGSADDLQITTTQPDLGDAIHAAHATRKLEQQRGDAASLHEQVMRRHSAAQQRDDLIRRLGALRADPIAQRYGGASWRNAVMATERAVAATEAPAGTAARFDARLDKLWNAALRR